MNYINLGYKATCLKCKKQYCSCIERQNGTWENSLPIIAYKEKPAKRLRRNPVYYAKELERNAERGRERNYHAVLKRRKQIAKQHQKLQKLTGKGRKPRRWTKAEIKYLTDNYKQQDIFQVAIALGRSWSSVHHKKQRLNLTTYKKYV